MSVSTCVVFIHSHSLILNCLLCICVNVMLILRKGAELNSINKEREKEIKNIFIFSWTLLWERTKVVY